MTNIDIKQKVLEDNEKVHDVFAKTHTRAVPYQSRKNTRNYIWSLIKKYLKQYNINVEGADVLEMACGTGTFVELFKKLKANSYIGVDISNEMIKLAKKQNTFDRATFEKCSLEEFSNKKENQNKYDIIIASSFLHHLYNIDEGLEQLKSMLKPGGIFIGLHEVIGDRCATSLEQFDYKLSELLGYNGGILTPFLTRLMDLTKFLMTTQKFIYLKERNNNISLKLLALTLWRVRKFPQKNKQKHYLLKFIPLWTTKIPQDKKRDIPDCKFVDYQLNFNFNLMTNEAAKKHGQVYPYCYYNIAELRFLRKLDNHCLFVMKKENE